MRTIEEYWNDCEQMGMIREEIPYGYKFTFKPEIGEGGFTILGDLSSFAIGYTDLSVHKPLIMMADLSENLLEFCQLYTGEVSYYKKKNELFPIEHGLNYLVHKPLFFGYQRIEPNNRLYFVGITYREKFFKDLPFELPDDFWERAAAVLNPEAITLPSVTLVCEQIKNCKLTGNALNLFLQSKALEAFSLTIDYVYSYDIGPMFKIRAEDKTTLEQAKTIITSELQNPPKISELAQMVHMNQQKLMSLFKRIYGMTIYTFIKKLRMEKAMNLLVDSDKPISEIASIVGYHGDGHFQRAFKECYATTPSKLRGDVRTQKIGLEECE